MCVRRALKGIVWGAIAAVKNGSIGIVWKMTLSEKLLKLVFYAKKEPH